MPERASRVTATSCGAASALTLDEFALWVDLQDDYWDKQGRTAVDAVAIFGGLLTMGAAGRGALAELGLLPELLATGVRREERERAAARDRRQRAGRRPLGRF